VVVEATKNDSGYACALKQHRHDRLNCGIQLPLKCSRSAHSNRGARRDGPLKEGSNSMKRSPAGRGNPQAAA
jgi:hypothetical protein